MNETSTFSDLRAGLSRGGAAATVIGTQSIGRFEAGPELLRDDLSFTRLAVHTETGALVCIKTISVPHPSSVPQALRAVAVNDAVDTPAAAASSPAVATPTNAQHRALFHSTGPFDAPATVAWLASKEFCQHLVEVKRLSQHPHISAWTDIIRTHKELHFVAPFLQGGPIMNAIKLRHSGFMARTSSSAVNSSAAQQLGGTADDAVVGAGRAAAATASGPAMFATRMNEDEARFYFQQLIAAMKFAHLRDLPHGDLHPDHLWLDRPLPHDPASAQIDKKSYQQKPKMMVVNFGFASVRAHSSDPSGATPSSHTGTTDSTVAGERGRWFSRATLAKCIEAVATGASESTSARSNVPAGGHNATNHLEELIFRVSCAAPELFIPSMETYQSAHSTAATAPPSIMTLNEDALKKCDVWSCGVLLYMFLTGEAPFPLQPGVQLDSGSGGNKNVSDDGSSKGGVETSGALPSSPTATVATNVASLETHIGDMLDRLHNGDVAFPSYLSQGIRGVRHLLALMLVPDPSKRITLKDIMAHPWFDVRLERSMMGMVGKPTPSPTLGAVQNSVQPLAASSGVASVPPTIALSASTHVASRLHHHDTAGLL